MLAPGHWTLYPIDNHTKIWLRLEKVQGPRAALADLFSKGKLIQ